MANVIDYSAPDGSPQEAMIERLDSIISNTGGTTSKVSSVNKFGFNNDVDTASEELLASFGGAFDPLTGVIRTAQTLTITYNNTTDGVSGTGAKSIVFQYLDENFEIVTASHVLGSTGSDVTSFTCLGVNRCFVASFGSLAVNTNDITATATIDATIQAVIPAGKSVTQQCIYHVPISSQFDIKTLFISALKVGAGSEPIVTIRMYSFSRVNLGRYEIAVFRLDTSVENNLDKHFLQPITTTGREVIYLTASTTIDNTAVSGRFTGTLEDLTA